MTVNKILKDNEYVPDLPEGMEYESYSLNPDGQTYTVKAKDKHFISKFQFFRELRARGLKAAFLQLADQSEDVKEWVDYGTFLFEFSDDVAAIAQALNITDVRDFFTKAKQIEL